MENTIRQLYSRYQKFPPRPQDNYHTDYMNGLIYPGDESKRPLGLGCEAWDAGHDAHYKNHGLIKVQDVNTIENPIFTGWNKYTGPAKYIIVNKVPKFEGGAATKKPTLSTFILYWVIWACLAISAGLIMYVGSLGDLNGFAALGCAWLVLLVAFVKLLDHKQFM